MLTNFVIVPSNVIKRAGVIADKCSAYFAKETLCLTSLASTSFTQRRWVEDFESGLAFLVGSAVLRRPSDAVGVTLELDQ